MGFVLWYVPPLGSAQSWTCFERFSRARGKESSGRMWPEKILSTPQNLFFSRHCPSMLLLNQVRCLNCMLLVVVLEASHSLQTKGSSAQDTQEPVEQEPSIAPLDSTREQHGSQRDSTPKAVTAELWDGERSAALKFGGKS